MKEKEITWLKQGLYFFDADFYDEVWKNIATTLFNIGTSGLIDAQNKKNLYIKSINLDAKDIAIKEYQYIKHTILKHWKIVEPYNYIKLCYAETEKEMKNAKNDLKRMKYLYTYKMVLNKMVYVLKKSLF